VSDRLERFGLLAGGLAGVLWLVSLFVLEGAGNPAGPESGEEIARFYRDDRALILVAATLHGLGGFLFLWFVAVVRGFLGGLAVPAWLAAATAIGGTAGGALMLALMGPQATGATTDKELVTPDVAIVFWRLAHGIFAAAEIALALFVAALSVVALRRYAFSRWLGWSGLVIAIVLLIPPLGWLALLFLLPLWLIVLSATLWRQTLSSLRAAAVPPATA
jgi:hypothetical protein